MNARLIISLALAGALAAGCSGTPETRTADAPAIATTSAMAQPAPAKNTEIEKSAKPHRYDKIGISVGDVGDTATTAYGLWSGVAVEANPVLAPLGDAVPIALLPVKIGLKHGLVKLGHTPASANVSINTGGMFATCANVLTLAGAAAPPAIALGAMCGLAYRDYAKRDYEAATGRQLDGSPAGE